MHANVRRRSNVIEQAEAITDNDQCRGDDNCQSSCITRHPVNALFHPFEFPPLHRMQPCSTTRLIVHLPWFMMQLSLEVWVDCSDNKRRNKRISAPKVTFSITIV